ncbi:MAG TPA: ABC transporter substrate-binding protein [Pseudonocardiaceae bacterium]|nr:ABC transporter substrate-binding protein [Pseudonocardiaceae bacterium]
MKRFKVVSTAGAAVVLLALTAACSSSGSSSTASGGSTGGSTTGGSTSGKSYKMTFIQGVAGDGFYVTMGCGIQAEATKVGNVTVNIQGPTQFDPTLQNPIIESVTAAKPDAILIAPDDVSASRPPIAQAMAAGIKVVLVDTTLSDPSGAVSQISSDNLAGGADAFAAIKQLVPNGGEVFVVNTKPGISTTDQRTQGFADAAKADSKYKYVGVQYDNDTASLAAQVTLAALQKNPNIVGIFATNLFSAEGAATGIRQAGKSGKVKVVGFDADPDQITALKQGTVQALIAQAPYAIGTNAVDQAVAALSGKPTTAKIGTKFTIITSANLNSAASQAAIYKTKC